MLKFCVNCINVYQFWLSRWKLISNLSNVSEYLLHSFFPQMKSFYNFINTIPYKFLNLLHHKHLNWDWNLRWQWLEGTTHSSTRSHDFWIISCVVIGIKVERKQTRTPTIDHSTDHSNDPSIDPTIDLTLHPTIDPIGVSNWDPTLVPSHYFQSTIHLWHLHTVTTLDHITFILAHPSHIWSFHIRLAPGGSVNEFSFFKSVILISQKWKILEKKSDFYNTNSKKIFFSTNLLLLNSC